MKFLLINTNQIVQKLVEITAKKAGAKITTITDSSKMGDLAQYDYVIIDDDCLLLDKQTYLDALKDKRKCLIYNKGAKRIDGFDSYIQKPFLPTSILDIFTEQLKKQPQDGAMEEVDELLDVAEDNISLENLDEGLDKIDSLLQEDDIPDENADTADTQAATDTESTDDVSDDDLGDLGDLDSSESKDDIESLGGDSIDDEVLDLPSDDMDLPNDENIATATAESVSNEDLQDTDEADLGDIMAEGGDKAEGEDKADELDENLSTDEDLEFPTNEAGSENLDDGLDVDLDFTNLDALSEDENNKSGDEADSTPDENADTADTQAATDTESTDDVSDDDLGDLDSSESKDDIESLGGDSIDDEVLDLPSDDKVSESNSDDIDLPNDENIDTAESASNEDLQDTDEADLGDIMAESGDKAEGEEDNLLDDVEEDIAQEPKPEKSVLDEEDVSEVSNALNALDTTRDEEDFSSLKEPDVAHALGEEIESEDFEEDSLTPEQDMPSETEKAEVDTQVLDESQEQETHDDSEKSQEFVKNIIANSVQSSIASLHSDNFKSMLDGLEVTINISFKDKSK